MYIGVTVYAHGSSAVIQTPTHSKLIGRTIPVPPPVSSPSVSLRFHSRQEKLVALLQKGYFLIFNFF
jgi:hypothetical protein